MAFRFFCPWHMKDCCILRESPTHCNGHQIYFQINNLTYSCSETIEHVRENFESQSGEILDDLLTSSSPELKKIVLTVITKMKERDQDE